MKTVIASIIIAFILWYLTFITKPFNFWLMMTFNTLFLGTISFRGGQIFRRDEWNIRNIIIGVGAAILLYGIFFVGNHILVWASDSIGIIPKRAENLDSIYANSEAVSPALIAMLLFFPIGFGEEVFPAKMGKIIGIHNYGVALHRCPCANGKPRPYSCCIRLRDFLGRFLLPDKKHGACHHITYGMGSIHFYNLSSKVRGHVRFYIYIQTFKQRKL